MPAGWKPKTEKSSSSFDGFLSNDEDIDLDNIMDMKRQTTLQSVKVNQSIKEASLYIGTAMCLLPDGTEPEAVPNFSWKTDKDEVADLSPLTRPRSEDMTPAKEISFVTPVPVKPSPDEGKTTKFEYKTQTKPLKKVDIDIGSGLNFGISGPRAGPLINKLQPPPDEGKTKSFRLSQAPKTPQDGSTETTEGGQKPGQSSGHPTGSSPTLSQASTLTSVQGGDKTASGTKPGRKDSIKKERKTDGPAGKTGAAKAARKPIAAPPQFKKLTKEEELTLLQKIVKEEWFTPGIPPILDLVNDELTKLLEASDTKVFVAVCDYIVQIFQQLSIAPKFMNRAGDKLTKQLNGPSAIARKKAVWTMKQLGLAAKKDVISALLPGLLDAKEGSREELISNLGELLSGPGAADGLSTLMSSLGITNKPLGTKEEQQAAIKAISERLQAEAEKLKSSGGSADSVKQRVEMWVSSLNLPSDGSSLLPSRAVSHDSVKQRVEMWVSSLNLPSDRSSLLPSMAVSIDSVKQRVEMWVSSLYLPSDGSSLLPSRAVSNNPVKQRVEMWVSSLNLPSDGSSLLPSRASNSRALDSSGNPRAGTSGLDTEGSFDKSSRQSTRGSRRKSRGGGRKKGVKSKGKGRLKSSSGQDGAGEDKDDTVSVDMSVQTDPRSEDAGDDEESLIRKRRGRWRRGGLSQFRERDDDATDEEDADFDADDEDDDEGVYADTDEEGGRPRRGRRRGKRGEEDTEEDGRSSGTFIRIEYDLTPGMFRSETGGSEWSDDLPPPANTT
ncbi:WD repeat-containing protein 87 [Elysia marginata]|uniref:WD repeat-containing protein 87 n=1 Tax=Elysia marginata TaxID=1093978 RepID=A0AAV4HEM5_9GAST|nr:WD repeat-containing protein 87 [Elysia marginata]